MLRRNLKNLKKIITTQTLTKTNPKLMSVNKGFYMPTPKITSLHKNKNKMNLNIPKQNITTQTISQTHS